MIWPHLYNTGRGAQVSPIVFDTGNPKGYPKGRAKSLSLPSPPLRSINHPTKNHIGIYDSIQSIFNYIVIETTPSPYSLDLVRVRVSHLNSNTYSSNFGC